VKVKFSKWSYVVIPVSIILFGLLIYPTLYKYDKLEQQYPVKINRITGEAHILKGNGWVNTSDSRTYEDKMLAYKQEIQDLIIQQNEDISEKVAASVKNDIIVGVSEQLASVEEEITAYKNHKTDPDNYFSLGASMATVKSIMGTPDTVLSTGPYDTWFYGTSTVKFDSNKVSGWDNDGNNLMIK
jgi:hypothetical protein